MALSKKQKEWWMGFSPAALATFALMPTQPPPALKKVMAIFIDSQVASGNWPNPSIPGSGLMDCFQFYAMDTAANAVINWIGSFSNGLFVNSPTHDPFRGVTGDGVTESISTQYNPTGDGINVSQNDFQFGAWMVDNLSVVSNARLFGNVLVRMDQHSTGLRMRSNSNVTVVHQAQTTFTDGKLYSGRRVEAANQILLEDDIGNTTANVSTGLLNGSVDLITTLNCKIGCSYFSGAIGFDTTSFKTNLKILIDATAALG